jgi:NDP-sugar pyrophosphorylase family protein
VLNGDILTDPNLTECGSCTDARLAHDDLSAAGAGSSRAGSSRPTPTGASGRSAATADEEITTNTINAGIYLIDAQLLGGSRATA